MTIYEYTKLTFPVCPASLRETDFTACEDTGIAASPSAASTLLAMTGHRPFFPFYVLRSTFYILHANTASCVLRPGLFQSRITSYESRNLTHRRQVNRELFLPIHADKFVHLLLVVGGNAASPRTDGLAGKVQVLAHMPNIDKDHPVS